MKTVQEILDLALSKGEYPYANRFMCNAIRSMARQEVISLNEKYLVLEEIEDYLRKGFKEVRAWDVMINVPTLADLFNILEVEYDHKIQGVAIFSNWANRPSIKEICDESRQ